MFANRLNVVEPMLELLKSIEPPSMIKRESTERQMLDRRSTTQTYPLGSAIKLFFLCINTCFVPDNS